MIPSHAYGTILPVITSDKGCYRWACRGADLVWGICAQITVGRLAGNTLVIADSEVSGQHATICWESSCRCWQVSGALLAHAMHAFSRSSF